MQKILRLPEPGIGMKPDDVHWSAVPLRCTLDDVTHEAGRKSKRRQSGVPMSLVLASILTSKPFGMFQCPVSKSTALAELSHAVL